MSQATMGIDVSKQHLDLCIRWSEKKHVSARFPYTAKGQAELLAWLEQKGVHEGLVCLEATGRYSFEIAETLFQKGYQVSIENPLRIKHFAISQMLRQKTDKLDAKILADYAALMSPKLWQPKSVLASNLQELQRLIEDMQSDRTRLINRMEGLRHGSVARPHLERQLKRLEEEMKQIEEEVEHLVEGDEELSKQLSLLSSIKGIGKKSALQLLAEIPCWSRFATAEQLVAYAGLCPQQVQSGNTSYSYLSKRGNANIRKSLYFPALSAMQHNPHLRVFAQRLKASGKAKMLVVAAVMRKLLVLAYTIVKSGRAYDPNYVPAA